MSGFRPGAILLGIVALCLAIVVLAARAGVNAAPLPPAGGAWLDMSQPVQLAKKNKNAVSGSSDYAWSATRIESELRLRGSVPSDEDRHTVLGMVKAQFPDLEVEDGLKVTAGAPPQDQWLGAVSFGLKQLSHLKRGSARLFNVTLRMDGEARTAADYVEVKKALTGPLPTGLAVAKGSIKPPVADPFTFVADLGADALSLSGSVPNEDTRNELRQLSRQLFRRPGFDERLELASGAPKGWDEAVIAALHALSQLESGKVALSGLAVTIEGVAPDKGTAVAISYQLRRDLPALFSTSENISWKEAAVMPATQALPGGKTLAATGAWWPQATLPDLLLPRDGH